MIFKQYQMNGNLTETIEQAIARFYKTFHTAPVIIRVNKARLEDVAATVMKLEIPVPVKTNGGTLLYELELGYEEEEAA